MHPCGVPIRVFKYTQKCINFYPVSYTYFEKNNIRLYVKQYNLLSLNEII